MKKLINKKSIAFVLMLAIISSQVGPSYTIIAQAEENEISATISTDASTSDSSSTTAATPTAPTNPDTELPSTVSSGTDSSSATSSVAATSSETMTASISNATTTPQNPDPVSSPVLTGIATTTSTSTASSATSSSSSTSTAETATSTASTTSTIGGAVSAPASPSSVSTTTPVTGASGTGTSTSSNDGEGGNDSDNNPTIQSGKAVALANILNIVNTNLVNSKGAVLLHNFIDDREGGVDFRNSASTPGTCAILSCNGVDGVQVHVLNDAQIRNALILQASSGDNRIRGGDNASILTGDAYAGLNLVNIANTNIIDSNYLLITLNAFKDVNGDITFPSLSKLFSSGGGTTSLNSAATQLSSDVQNNITSNAESGMNHTSQSGTGTVNTGDSHSSANVFNQLNSSLIGGDNVSILVRVHGNWAGQVFGAPEGVDLTAMDDGSMFLSNQAFGTSPHGMAGRADFTGRSTSSIINDIELDALTGANRITGASNALISTGNAFAGANLVNISNANVIGRNWILAIINIFGDFKGNIAFGRPDLWVGEQIIAPDTVQNGTELSFKSTVINNGDSAATNVKLATQFDNSHMDMIDSSAAHTTDAQGRTVWNIGTLPAGGATEITFRGRLKNTSPGMNITSTVSVTGTETDNNMEDNTDTATVKTNPEVSRTNGGHRRNGGSSGSSGGGAGSLAQAAASSAALQAGQNSFPIEITRMTPSATVTSTSSTISQEIVLHNPLETKMASIVLHDILYDPNGNVIQDEKWDVGDLLPHEEVTIRYDIDFGSEATNGVYSLSTVLSQPTVDKALKATFAKNGLVLVMKDQSAKIVSATKAKTKAAPIAAKKKPAAIAKAKKISAPKVIAATTTEIAEPALLAPAVAHAETNQDQTASAANSISVENDSVFSKFISAIKVIPTFIYTKINSITGMR